MHVCPMVSGIVPHVGGPIIPVAALHTFVRALPSARIGDLCTCVGPLDIIVEGSPTVLIEGKCASRVLDMTAHGGAIITGDFGVTLIGTQGSGGASMPVAALSAPQVNAAMAAAIFPGRQNYQNCGVQSSQQIIFLATSRRVGESPLLMSALFAGDANWGTPPGIANAGGTSAVGRQNILKKNGVESTIQPTTTANLGQAIKDGKGVIVNADPGVLWNNPKFVGQGHAVTVTGGTFDSSGNLQTVNINDTGTGQQTTMPASTFMSAANAKNGGSQMNVTDDKIWP